MIVNIDIETRSACDLFKAGSYKYAEDPSTKILCYAYKIDDNPVAGVMCEDIPYDLAHAITHGATIRGWNIVNFDVPVWNARFPGCPIKLEQCDDTMDRARAAGLPGALGPAAQFMNLSIRKDLEGHNLMKRLCKAENPEPTAAELERLLQYCEVDVEVEADLANRIPPLPDIEQYAVQLSHRINQKGILIDLELASRAVEFAEEEKQSLSDRLLVLTNHEVERHTQRDRLLKWLRANGLPKLPNLQKQTLIDHLEEETTPANCKEIIDIRLSGAKASTAKFQAAVNMACSDGRVRGTFIYFGAPATGRFSGWGIQPHNFPRDTAEDPYALLDAIQNKEVVSIYKALSSLLRPMIMAPEGKKLVRCDFSAIEGRVVAWLAGDKPALKEYAGEGKMYERAAAAIYGVPMSRVTKEQRQIGKVSELACGFQGGWKAFDSMARNYGVKVPPAEAKKIVKAWRKGRPAVVNLWHEVEAAAVRAYRAKGKPVTCCAGKVFFVYDPTSKRLWIGLPSKRFICLPDFKVSTYDGPYGPAERLTYKRGNWKPKQGDTEWPRSDTYGGSLVESLAQGIARDLLVWAMLELEDWGIVMHVHDEIVCEVDDDAAEQCLESMEGVMSITPKWAPGLPLAAVGEISDRFGK